MSEVLCTQVCIRARPFPQSFNDFKIILEVSQGFRPQRPSDDMVDDNLWALIDRCWAQDPLARPRMSEVLRHFALLTWPSWNMSGRCSHFSDYSMDEIMEDAFPSRQALARRDKDESWVHNHCECTCNNAIFLVDTTGLVLDLSCDMPVSDEEEEKEMMNGEVETRIDDQPAVEQGEPALVPAASEDYSYRKDSLSGTFGAWDDREPSPEPPSVNGSDHSHSADHWAEFVRESEIWQIMRSAASAVKGSHEAGIPYSVTPLASPNSGIPWEGARPIAPAQTTSKSRRVKANPSFSRSDWRTSRRSLNNGVGARDNTLSMASQESSNSQVKETDGTLSPQQAIPLTLSPSAYARLWDLTLGRTNVQSDFPGHVPAVSAADLPRYGNSKLFPSPGIIRLEEERNRSKNVTAAESENAPFADIALTALSGTDSSGVVPTSTGSNDTARLERMLLYNSRAAKASASVPPIPDGGLPWEDARPITPAMEQTAFKSRWVRVKQSFTRSKSRTGRRSRNNSINARDNTLSMASRESGISQGSAPGGKDGMLPTQLQQATPPTLSPSPSTTLLDLTSGRTNGRNDFPGYVPAVSAADLPRYGNSKLFPFPGLVRLEEERNRSKNVTPAESANAPSPDTVLTALSGTNSSGVVPTTTCSDDTARLEQMISRQRSHTSCVAKASASPIPASVGNSQGSQHEHPDGQLDMPELVHLASLHNLKQTGEKGVKRWFTVSGRLFSSTSPTPAEFNRGGQQSAFGRFTSRFQTKGEAGRPGPAS
jgi:hypothetical protein